MPEFTYPDPPKPDVVMIVEDGSAIITANAYVGLDEANAFFANQLYPGAWFDQSDAQKARAIITATTALEACFKWHGYAVNEQQQLGWPRIFGRDPSRTQKQIATYPHLEGIGPYWPPDQVPIPSDCHLPAP